MPQQPGWYEVPGKGRRYWNGKDYQFFGPSDSASSKGQMSVSNDIGGMWNNFVGKYGQSTADPSKVGLLPHQKAGFDTREQHLQALEKKRAQLKAQEDEPPAAGTVAPQTVQTDNRLGSVDKPTAYPTNAKTKTIKQSKDFQKKTPPETPLSIVRPETTTTNANGVVQTGTQMSSTLGDFNDMYARVVGKHNMSATAYNPFESVHLHTQGDSREDMVNDGPSSYSPGEAAAFNSGQGIEWSSDQKVDAPYTIPKPADVTSTEGAPQIVKSGAQKVVKGVNGHEFGGDHEAPATMKRDRTSQLRRKWMLGDMKDEKGNDLSNIQRLRGMRMEQGVDRQGDKFYAMGSLDPANESKPTEISQDQYRQAVVSDAGRQQVATDLKDAYTSRIKNEGNKETTAPILPTQADAESFGTSIAEQYLKTKKPIKK